MNGIDSLLKGWHNCSCGKEHDCPIEAVRIGKGAIACLERLCESYHHILFVTDDRLWPQYGEKVYTLIQAKACPLVLNENGRVVIPNEQAIAEITACITPDTDLIVGLGSGVINDLCKHVSFQHYLPYMIVATAPSMDGFASVGAALILEGMKITLGARPPKAIIGDTDILKNAPMEMLQSGWGDIIGKYSCLNDWKLSALINGEYFCQAVYDLVHETAKNVETLASGILQRDEQAIAALMEALVIVGIAMSFVGNSRPASGSEHHLSHYFEITGILHNEPYYPHGTDVLYSSVVTARLREILANSIPARQSFDSAAWEKEIRRIYTSSADGVIHLQKKLGWHEKNDFFSIAGKWGSICKILREAPTEKEMIQMVQAIGLDINQFNAFYGKEKINDAILYAKDLKDRYSVLWLFERAHAPVCWL